MLNGTPSVTTAIGSESMHGELPWSGAVSDDPNTFCYMATHLYNDPKAWQTAVDNGNAIIYQHYNKTLLGNKLIERVNQLRQTLDEHRLANFTGAMLRHHHHKSTKYMAQWIEAKNKTS